MLGVSEYARIKAQIAQRVGKEGRPVAERTKLGWFLMSQWQEFDTNQMMLTQTSHADCDELCRLDVLGLSDAAEHDQSVVYQEFKDQLVRDKEGWYATGLPWRGDHLPLPNNKQGSLRRLHGLTRKLTREGLTADYQCNINEQQELGIIELAPENITRVECYIPHWHILSDSVTTNLRIIYGASARA